MTTPKGQTDPIDNLIYNIGDVEIKRSPTHTRMWLIVTPRPHLHLGTYPISVMADDFQSAVILMQEKIERFRREYA